MLRLRQLIPPLTARTAAGGVVRAWDFKQKRALLIAFLHAGCERCEEFAHRVCDAAAQLAECEAAALLIFPQPPAGAWTENLPANIIAAADLSGRSQAAYLGADAYGNTGLRLVGAFVADRYGELYAQWAGADESALPGMRDALGWLGQIQVACEECGVSHWPQE